MKPPKLPSLRALQVFASFGRTLSVTQTAQELGVTSGAVSQQLKVLEEQTGRTLFNRQGRGIFLRPGAETYHKHICDGFETLAQAQHILDRIEDTVDVSISALPSLLSRWLNPVLSAYQDHNPEMSLRLDSTHKEPERHLLSTTFRLTYGANADTFPYRRRLFQDAVFPVCAPAFLSQFPWPRIRHRWRTCRSYTQIGVQRIGICPVGRIGFPCLTCRLIPSPKGPPIPCPVSH